MAKQPRHRIVLSPETLDHLREMPARDRATVTDNVEKKLQYQPTVATRNKKLLQANPVAEWELRVEKWRVYYDLKQDEQGPFVLVKGVGLKRGNKVLIGGVEIEL